MSMIHADAEQAKATGGMIALGIDPSYLDSLTIDGGEPADDLHLTMVYFGEDVTDLSSYAAQTICEDITAWSSPLACKAFAHATFNPSTENACAVYLIGDGADLSLLHKDIFDGCNAMYDLRQQHLPWLPHVTAGYGFTAADLSYEGEIVFDRIVVEWAGESFDYPL